MKKTPQNNFESWFPIIIGAVAFIFFCAATYYVIGAEREVVYAIGEVSAETPEVYVRPTAHTLDVNLYQRQFADRPALTYYGLLFRVPWTEEPAIEKGTRGVTLKFSAERTVLVQKGEFDVNSFCEDIFGKEEGAQVVEKIQGAYGKQFTADPYIFYREILNSSPDNITFLTIQNKAEMEMYLLKMKQRLVSILLEKDTIYEIETYYIRGFQFGKGGDPFVAIDLFNRANEPYSLFIKGGTQEDIDFILSSIR